MANPPDARVAGLSGVQIHWSLTQGPGRSSLGEVGDGWRAMAGEYTQAQARIEQVLNTVHATWEGAGADSAHSAISPLADWANTASQSATVAEMAVNTQGDAFTSASNKVLPMQNIPDAPFGNGFGIVTTDHDKALTENNARTAVNRDVLAGYGGGTSSTVTSLPRFEAPVDVGTALTSSPTPLSPPPTSGPVNAQGSSFGNSTAPSGSAGSNVAGPRSGGQPQPGWTPQGASVPNAPHRQPGQPVGSTPGEYSPVVQTASASGLDGSLGGSGAGSGAYGSGGYGRNGSGGSGGSSAGGAGNHDGGQIGYGGASMMGGGSFGPGSPGTPGYGSSGSGSSGSGGARSGGSIAPGGQSGAGPGAGESAVRGGGVAGGASAAGARGTGAGGGMGGMGGGRGSGSEDDEHAMPDFLKTEDVFGCTVSYCPPVIGVDPPRQ